MTATDKILCWTAVLFGLGASTSAFAEPRLAVANFGYNQGWRNSAHLRFATDITGDRRADLVGFGQQGVWVSRNRGNGTFDAPRFVIADFGYDRGWRVDKHDRTLADVNKDTRNDIVAFGDHGVWIALGQTDGTFSTPVLALADFGSQQGYAYANRYSVDINGDRFSDLLAFGADGAWTALSLSDGAFAPARFASDELAQVDGTSPPVTLVDTNRDRRTDILFLTETGLRVAYARSDGTFEPSHDGGAAGFQTTYGGLFIHAVADVNADGNADLIAFHHSENATYVALGLGNGSFAAKQLAVRQYGGTEWAFTTRLLADHNANLRADIVGFAANGAYTALANADGTFGAATLGYPDFGANNGWRSDLHRIFLADVNGDVRADIVAFGDAGVYVQYAVGDGTFR
jgi:hypothetical protein